ncbi:MAG: PIN domain-containing protein [Coriobacteriia bacterium]|nr:PIN domain-containing protein [Actinomycetota bacterium]MDZ4166873.1 PIN domain-containing protein [Coriobacteriia bacterium]
MDRVFLDANVLVSAALKPGSAITTLWTLPDTRLLASPYVLAEARRNVKAAEAAQRLESLIGALAVLPTEPADFAIEDDPGLPPKDRPILLAAIVSGAAVLLTSDITHFGACLGSVVNGVRILMPGQYLRSRE